MADMRAMFAVTHVNHPPTEAAPVEEVVNVAPEVTQEAAEPVAETQQTERTRGADGKFVKADGAAPEVAPEPEVSTVEEKEEPLPANVQKRIAKEVAEQTRIDREIQQAVSARKAKQAELDRLKADTGTSGSEPATTTAPAKTNKPAKPTWDKEGDPDAVKFWLAQSEYERKNEDWLVAEATRVATEQTEARIQAREHSARVAAKVAEGEAKHGKGFDGMRQQIVDGTPEGLQIEIGSNEEWPDTVAHLAKNPDEMAALSALYSKNPSMAIRELGRLEDRLKKPPAPITPPAAVAASTIPPPPARVGGGASVAPKVDMEKAPMSVFKQHPAFKR